VLIQVVNVDFKETDVSLFPERGYFALTGSCTAQRKIFNLLSNV